MVQGRRVVDTHHHLWSPGFVASKGDLVRSMTKDLPSLAWRPESSIALMDEAGVSRTILSHAAPGVWFGDVKEGRYLSREVNEFAAASVEKFPSRLGFFASIPLPDTEGSLAEIAYALDVLGADGIVLMTSYGEKYLSDERFIPVLEELNRRKAVVYVHPCKHPCCNNLIPELPDPFLEFVFDTTRTIASLLFTGSLYRTRDIRWLFSHGGGTLPMVAGRISGYATLNRKFDVVMPDGPMAELRRLYFDTANVTHPESLAGLRKFAAADHILFGSDAPMIPIAVQLERLRTAGLAEVELQAIEHGNADLMMPLRPAR